MRKKKRKPQNPKQKSWNNEQKIKNETIEFGRIGRVLNVWIFHHFLLNSHDNFHDYT